MNNKVNNLPITKYIEILEEQYDNVVEDENINIQDAVGITYCIYIDDKNEKAIIVHFSTQLARYKIVSVSVLQEEKKRKLLEFVGNRKNVNFFKSKDCFLTIHSTHKKIDKEDIQEYFGMYKKHGLYYSVDYEKNIIYLDFESVDLTPDYVWAIFYYILKFI